MILHESPFSIIRHSSKRNRTLVGLQWWCERCRNHWKDKKPNLVPKLQKTNQNREGASAEPIPKCVWKKKQHKWRFKDLPDSVFVDGKIRIGHVTTRCWGYQNHREPWRLCIMTQRLREVSHSGSITFSNTVSRRSTFSNVPSNRRHWMKILSKME